MAWQPGRIILRHSRAGVSAGPLLTLDLPHVLSSSLQSFDSGSSLRPRSGVPKDISPVVDLNIYQAIYLDYVQPRRGLQSSAVFHDIISFNEPSRQLTHRSNGQWTSEDWMGTPCCTPPSEMLKRAKQCLGPYIPLTTRFQQKAIRDRGRLLANHVGPEPLRLIPISQYSRIRHY